MKQFFRFLCKHRRNIFMQKLDEAFFRFHKKYENLNYDYYSNGEDNVLRRINAIRNCSLVFDVGANKGDWTLIASNRFPHAVIHSFEIVPQTYRLLVSRCHQLKNVHLHNIGLSDTMGTVPVYFMPDNSGVATCVPAFFERFHQQQPNKLEVITTTGDIFCANEKIYAIDFLKIDVEGYEDKVLKGFQSMLKKGRIKIIQFEYGYININTHFLLKDFYDYLGSFDMKIGKIYPTYVDFKEYRYRDENFFGPNYLAVHSSCEQIIDVLSVS